MDSTRETGQTAATAYLKALWARGIEYVFANAGTDFAPVIEALIAAEQSGLRVPRFVTVPHENVAVSMAQGYYRMTGRMAGVMVHVSVGTANTICGLMNSYRDNVPIMLLAGRTPITETGDAGSRSNSIHWGQEIFDQGNMVREYVKWDYELRAGQDIGDIVGRALDIAMSDPKGPVYLSLPREVLGAEDVTSTEPRDRPVGTPAPAPAEDAIDEAAAMIAQAAYPLILTSTSGRNFGAVAALADLAREFAIPVVQVGPRDLNIPASHSMNMGSAHGFPPAALLGAADAVIALDCEVPWIPSVQTPNADAKLIHIAGDPLFSRYPTRGFGIDLAVAGSTAAALPMLARALKDAAKGKSKAIDERRETLAETRQAIVDKRAELIAGAKTSKPLHAAWIAHCINQAKGENTIIVNELGVQPDLLELEKPGSFLAGSPAGALGFALGGALGAKLGSPESDVIAIVGDGSYMFGNPTPAHFVAQAEGLATLTIVCNNAMWFAVQRATIGMYPDGLAAKANRMPLVDLDPSPAYEKTIEACGGYGERVETPEDVLAAIDRGLEKVRSGTPALLNMITMAGGRG